MVFEDHSVIIQALRIGLIEHEASDTGGVPRWKSSCPDRLAEATKYLDISLNSVGGVWRRNLAAAVAYLVQQLGR